MPRAPVLVAEVGGEPWAARSLRTGQVIADPFRTSGHVVELLEVRAEQLSASAPPNRDDRSRGRLTPSGAPAR